MLEKIGNILLRVWKRRVGPFHVTVFLCRVVLIFIMAEGSDIPPTVLSALQATPIPDNIVTSSLHPFSASSEKIVTFLYTLLETTEGVATSVALHSAAAVNDSRTVSLLRQQSAGQHTLHLVHPLYLMCSSQLRSL
jgi:hypothetical protein